MNDEICYYITFFICHKLELHSVNNPTYPTVTTLNQLAGVLLFLVENPSEWLPEHIQEPELVIILHYKTVQVML